MNPMEQHVKIVGVLHIVFGALGVLIGVVVFAVMGGVAGLIQMDGDEDAAQVAPFLGVIGGIVFAFLLVLSVPGIIAGVGLLYFQSWARILTIVLSILDLLNIPFGTVLGIYSLWVLFKPEATRLFEQRPVPSMQYQR
jgi:hypothetical protein